MALCTMDERNNVILDCIKIHLFIIKASEHLQLLNGFGHEPTPLLSWQHQAFLPCFRTKSIKAVLGSLD